MDDLLKVILSGAWAILLIPLKLLWEKVQSAVSNDRLDEVTKALLPRAEFDSHIATVMESRANNRQDIKELFEGQARLRELVDAKVNDAVRRVEDRLDRMRSEFNSGLHSIRDEIRGRS